MKIFADTNVLVSALATRGLCADLLQLIITEHDLVTGEVVLVELERILARKLRLPEATITRQLAALRRYPVTPKPTFLSAYEVRDPDDRLVLTSALAAGADALVTGDKDLLAIRDEVSELIITEPRGLWELLRGNPGAPPEEG